MGQTITKCIQILSASPLEEPFKRISFLYSDHCYVVFKSAKTLKIVHKKVEEDIPLDLYIPPSLWCNPFFVFVKIQYMLSWILIQSVATYFNLLFTKQMNYLLKTSSRKQSISGVVPGCFWAILHCLGSFSPFYDQNGKILPKTVKKSLNNAL